MLAAGDVGTAAETLGLVLERVASAWPSHVAVADERTELTYRQLDELSTSVARELVARGVRLGDRVAVLARKEAAVLIAMFAAFKAGAVFLPLDAKAPRARVKQLLQDARPPVLILGKDIDTSETAWGPPTVLALQELVDPLRTAAARNVELPHVLPENVAYCIYTSGSTGSPKGVLIEHRSVLAFFEAVNRLMHVDHQARCLNTSPFHFDVSVVDTLLPLSQGATVYLSGDVVLPALLLEQLERLRITHVCAVASTLNLLSRGRNLESRALSLVCIMTGAEVLNVAAIQTWLRAVPGITIINGYGPTEATCVCVAHAIREVEPDRQALYPIGFPLNGVEVQICDDSGVPVEPGIVGEIVVGGSQLMREYLGRPEETNARWLELNGKRFYRTGDLGQKDDTGLLSFVGRVDQEVKLRGYRVHLNEVRQALLEQPGVEDAALHLVEHGLRGRDLAATVLSRSLATPLSGAFLLDQLRARLPEYMVPRYLFLTSTFPKLSSGKIDQRALDNAAQAQVARVGVEVCVLAEAP